MTKVKRKSKNTQFSSSDRKIAARSDTLELLARLEEVQSLQRAAIKDLFTFVVELALSQLKAN